MFFVFGLHIIFLLVITVQVISSASDEKRSMKNLILTDPFYNSNNFFIVPCISIKPYFMLILSESMLDD